MALIGWGSGSELYIYHTGAVFICCSCSLTSNINTGFETKEELKAHILRHKEAHHGIGITGNPITYQSYDELLGDVDCYEP